MFALRPFIASLRILTPLWKSLTNSFPKNSFLLRVDSNIQLFRFVARKSVLLFFISDYFSPSRENPERVNFVSRDRRLFMQFFSMSAFCAVQSIIINYSKKIRGKVLTTRLLCGNIIVADCKRRGVRVV